MRILIAPFFLLAACSAKPRLAPTAKTWNEAALRAAREQIAQARLPLGRLKETLFMSLLEKGPANVEGAKLQRELRAAEKRWLLHAEEALLKAAAEAKAEGATKDQILESLVPASERTPKETKTELDMIVHAQDLKPAQRKQLIHDFAAAARRCAILQAQIASDEASMLAASLDGQPQDSAAAQGRLLAADDSRTSVILSAMIKAARTIHSSPLDRDYAYRAYLREHRRHVPGFAREQPDQR